MRFFSSNSKKQLWFTTLYAIALPLSIQLISLVFALDNPILSLFSLVFLVSLLYSLPLIFNLFQLRKSGQVSIGKFILNDLIYYFLPFAVSAAINDVVFTLVYESYQAPGFFSAVIIISCILLTLIFWAGYLLISKTNNRP